MIKKSLYIFICFLLILTIVTGCIYETNSLEENDINIVCCGFSEYDWVRNIVGNVRNINLILMPDNGAELHSFQPTAQNVLDILTSDVVIYNGGESSRIIEDILNSNDNYSPILINCMELIGENILIEHHTHTDELNLTEHYEADEHLWLSFRNASVICRYIEDVLSVLDAEHKGVYEKNVDEFILKLNGLDEKYSEIISRSKYNEVVFADRFPFKYLLNDYGISYTAAFPGCSTEADASFATIVSLAEKLNDIGGNKVIVLENSSSSIASAVSEICSKNLEILTMNSMQSVNYADILNGLSYLDVMEKNLNVLEQALN